MTGQAVVVELQCACGSPGGRTEILMAGPYTQPRAIDSIDLDRVGS